jgi:hypothetical protein
MTLDPTLCVVTASTDLERARPCLESWAAMASQKVVCFLILNGVERSPARIDVDNMVIAYANTPDYLGSVSAFRRGVDAALMGPFDVIACLHDDFEIKERNWDLKVTRAFARNENLGLAGFGGAISLGHEDMYLRPYDPMSLARGGFRSDLTDAEVHGFRSLLSEQVACLDGFSQIGRRAFFEGKWSPARVTREQIRQRQGHPSVATPAVPVWAELEDLGIVHHLYDSLLGAQAARAGWETWYLPLRATHHGGRTAVGDRGYQDWAKSVKPKGDQGFWEEAHRIGYEAFRDVLPLRV